MSNVLRAYEKLEEIVMSIGRASVERRHVVNALREVCNMLPDDSYDKRIVCKVLDILEVQQRDDRGGVDGVIKEMYELDRPSSAHYYIAYIMVGMRIIKLPVEVCAIVKLMRDAVDGRINMRGVWREYKTALVELAMSYSVENLIGSAIITDLLSRLIIMSHVTSRSSQEELLSDVMAKINVCLNNCSTTS